jgi:hypothetical protein
MNGSIYGMNHSKRYEAELVSQPPPFERDANAIYQALVEQAGPAVAKARAHFLQGSNYDELCAGLLQSLRVCTTENIPDPQKAEDLAAMREEQYISDRGDAHREVKFGKGL